MRKKKKEAMSFRKRKNKGNEGSTRKKDKSNDNSSEEDDVGVIKTVSTKAKSAGGAPSEVLPSAFASTREAAAHEYGGGATAELATNTSTERDGRALLEKHIKLSQSDEAGDGIYRGMAAQKSFVRKDLQQASNNKNTGTHGPLRAPTFLRATSRFDYQPDVCKDYKQTGYCGFGDSCKFLHAREDYKGGHELEKEWEEEQRKKRKALDQQLKSFGDAMGVQDTDLSLSLADDDADAADAKGAKGGEGVPFACHICREPFQDPIVTLCGHYFCLKCVLSAEDADHCAICGKETQGCFASTDKVPNAKGKSKTVNAAST